MYKRLFLFLFFPTLVCAEPADTLRPAAVASQYPQTAEGLTFSPKQLALPGAFIALGVYGAIDRRWDKDVNRHIAVRQGDSKIDDALIFLPWASACALDLCGIRSKHSLPDKIAVMATAGALVLGSAFALKEMTRVERPDGSDRHSFPSRHTAIAFAGAELLRQEYGDRSVWYGVAGYGVAVGSGFLRVYHNRHWLSDVAVGAGIGILSAKAACWLYPSVRRLYAKDDNLSLWPHVSTSGVGMTLSARF
jgi:membrane-associated phospholipid phosphatase